MKILYDGFIFRTQKAGGINRYFAEVIDGLPSDIQPLVTGVTDFGQNAPRNPRLQQPAFKDFRPGRISRRVRERWWKPRLLDSVNLFHPTYYHLSDGYSLADFKCPVVVTAYDFIYAIYPKLIANSEFVICEQADAIRRATQVVCISKTTENDLLERFPEKRGQTTVIYLGSSFTEQAPVDEKQIFDQPAFLFVGGRAGYKNFSFLTRAFAKAAGANPRLRLRVAGAALNEEERWQLFFLGIADRVDSFVYPDEEKLKELYRTSVALVYPSLYEGFGIPPLEAMACRTLAITSNTASLPEVVGDGGIMLDPRVEADWIEALLQAATPGKDRPGIIKRGLAQLQKFSWQTCAAQHLDIYRRVAAR